MPLESYSIWWIKVPTLNLHAVRKQRKQGYLVFITYNAVRKPEVWLHLMDLKVLQPVAVLPTKG